MHPFDLKQIRIQVIEVELISLKARKAYAENLILNLSMTVEVKLLNEQIASLEQELSDVKKELNDQSL